MFSKLILKNTFFRHQYLSLLIAIIGIIFLIIPVCFVIGTQDILINILTCISTVGYSLYFVLIKYLKHVYYRSPFQLSFILV